MTSRHASLHGHGPEERLLAELRRRAGLYATWEELGAAVGMAPSDLESAADGLSALGYELDIHPARGVRLAGVPDVMLPAEIEACLLGSRFRGPVHCFGSVGSTNTVALALGRAAAPEGTLVVAESQSAGRGRFRRTWHSPAHLGLWFSLLLRPPVAEEGQAALSIVASLAVADAVKEVSGVSARLKWPNDVMAGGKKLAGILAEMAGTPGGSTFVALGVGLNVNQEREDFSREIRDRAISLREITGRSERRCDLLREMVGAFEERYERFLVSRLATMIPEWDALAMWQGEPVEIVVGSEVRSGIQAGLAESGGLLLRTPAGLQEVIMAGDLGPGQGKEGRRA